MWNYGCKITFFSWLICRSGNVLLQAAAINSCHRGSALPSHRSSGGRPWSSSSSDFYAYWSLRPSGTYVENTHQSLRSDVVQLDSADKSLSPKPWYWPFISNCIAHRQRILYIKEAPGTYQISSIILVNDWKLNWNCDLSVYKSDCWNFSIESCFGEDLPFCAKNDMPNDRRVSSFHLPLLVSGRFQIT